MSWGHVVVGAVLTAAAVAAALTAMGQEREVVISGVLASVTLVAVQLGLRVWRSRREPPR